MMSSLGLIVLMTSLAAGKLSQMCPIEEENAPENTCQYGHPEFDSINCLWKCNDLMDDVVLTTETENWVQEQITGLTSRAGSVEPRWTNQKQEDFYRVPFYYSSNLEKLTGRKLVINKALSVINALTCFKFEPAVSGDTDIIVFINGRGCYSYIGRTGGVQQISIGLGCGSVGTALHECLHALGFWHEQSRSDRDDYVKIVWDNVRSGTERNFFKKREIDLVSFNSSYDFKSVMHYSSFSFTNNGQATILNRTNEQPFDVQRSALSLEDEKQLNAMYSCNGTRGIPQTSDCYHPIDRGYSYRGKISITVGGKTCQRWDANKPHIPSYTPTLLTGAGLENNFCRNPTTDSGGPWCYTTDPNIRWEHCKVPTCPNPVQPVKNPIPFGGLPGFWTDFGNWSECSQTCGDGYQYRTRKCFGGTEGSSTCPGTYYEAKPCHSMPLSIVYGKWKSWGDWSECTKACGIGHRYRVRKCSTSICNGTVFEKSPCKNKDCPIYEGNGCFDKTDNNSYKGTISVSSTGKTCKKWRQTEIKRADYPKARLRKNFCRNPELKSVPYCFVDKETRENCSVPSCNEEAVWSNYSKFSSCSASCDGGMKYRLRKCIGGVIGQGECRGRVVKTKRCNRQPCLTTGPLPPPTTAPVTPPTVNESGCAFVGNASLYRGNISTTYSGIKCQRWDTLHPHPHNYRSLDIIEKAGLAENYCRAPESEDPWPWCYVLSYATIKAPCDVPECHPDPSPTPPPIGCQMINDPASYRGGKSTTKKGFTCQRWDYNSPHAHLIKSFNYPQHGLGAHNYCRTARFPILWCFTTSAHQLWDECDVPVCT